MLQLTLRDAESEEILPREKRSIFIIFFSVLWRLDHSLHAPTLLSLSLSLSVRHATGIRTDVTRPGRSERDLRRPANKDKTIRSEMYRRKKYAKVR